ncbi:MAG TPA: cytochrome C [Clostridia bacterium]|nr:cytochrome C [Clostridia bacterium]
MRGSLTLFLVVLAVTVAAFGGLVVHSLHELDPAGVPETVRLGKQVWQEKACVECHTVLGHGGYFGPDLTKAWIKYGAEGLQDFFRDPPLLPAAVEKRHLNLSERETELLAHFLRFVAGIKRTGNWPLQPPLLSPAGK